MGAQSTVAKHSLTKRWKIETWFHLISLLGPQMGRTDMEWKHGLIFQLLNVWPHGWQRQWQRQRQSASKTDCNIYVMSQLYRENLMGGSSFKILICVWFESPRLVQILFEKALMSRGRDSQRQWSGPGGEVVKLLNSQSKNSITWLLMIDNHDNHEP